MKFSDSAKNSRFNNLHHNRINLSREYVCIHDTLIYFQRSSIVFSGNLRVDNKGIASQGVSLFLIHQPRTIEKAVEIDYTFYPWVPYIYRCTYPEFFIFSYVKDRLERVFSESECKITAFWTVPWGFRSVSYQNVRFFSL